MAFGEELHQLGVYYGFHVLAPFPGTKVREESQAYGIRILTDDWSQYHANRAITETSSVAPKMVDEIVIGWERKFDEYLGVVKTQMQAGTATEEAARQLTGLERIVLIYDLMMSRALETHGSWPLNGDAGPDSEKDLLQVLVSRLAPGVAQAPEKMFDFLSLAHDQQNLRCRRENGTVQWEWIDFL